MADDDILQDRLDRLNRIGTEQSAIVRQALSTGLDALEAAYTNLAVRRREQQEQEGGMHGDDQDASEAFEIWACRHVHSGTLDLVCGFRFHGDLERIYAKNRKSHVRISSLAAELGVNPPRARLRARCQDRRVRDGPRSHPRPRPEVAAPAPSSAGPLQHRTTLLLRQDPPICSSPRATAPSLGQPEVLPRSHNSLPACEYPSPSPPIILPVLIGDQQDRSSLLI